VDFLSESMIIVNADDWGRSRSETDAALACYKEKRITSVTAMVFMEDSVRAADMAKDAAIDVGLHLNLGQRFTGDSYTILLQTYHDRVVRFFTLNKYSHLLYNPFLRQQILYTYQAQVDEFHQLYGRYPSHIDGHKHMHLCTNMLLDRVIPMGEKVRRSFSFSKGEKSLLNRLYRKMVDLWLARRYQLTDYFFSLSQSLQSDRLRRVAELAKSATVELMSHPANRNEYDYLMSDDYIALLNELEKGTYSLL
jgi:chitin disaccharide deacetylase